MDETYRLDEIDEMEYRSDRRQWVIPGGSDCDHGPDAVDRIGSAGLTEYYRCGRCGAVLLSAPS